MELNSIVLAAGKGSRLKHNKPKVLLVVRDKAIADRIYELLTDVGTNDLIFVVGHKKGMVMSHMKDRERIKFAVQKELNGTATAALIGLSEIKNNYPTLVIMGDHPFFTKKTIISLLKNHKANNAVISLVTHTVDDPRGYGIIVRDGEGKIIKIKETKGLLDKIGSREINTGCYIFEPEWAREKIKEIKFNSSGEYNLTDLFSIAYKEGKAAGNIEIDDYSEIMGINAQKDLKSLEG